MVAGAGDALNTQDNVRRDDAEYNDLSHVHNLTRSRLGRLPTGRAQTQIALCGGLFVSVHPRPAEPTASDSPVRPAGPDRRRGGRGPGHRSLVAYYAEHPANPGFATVGDALWWGIVTLTTVGYGDIVPETPAGRFAAVTIMITGVAVLGLLAGSLASFFRLDWGRHGRRVASR